MTAVGYALLIIGAIFCFLGGLGVLRMPDVYNRIQAGTKAVTLGTVSVIAGIAFLQPAWWPKLIALAGFVLLTSPVASSTIARALLRVGIQPWKKSPLKETGND